MCSKVEAKAKKEKKKEKEKTLDAVYGTTQWIGR